MIKQSRPTAVATITDTSAGVNGSQTFVLQNNDFNVLVAKLKISALTGSSPTVDIWGQTTDDGGTTFYDVFRLTGTGTMTLANAQFARIGDLKSDSKYIGAATSLSLASNSVSGLPILEKLMRVVWEYAVAGGTATVGTASWTLELLQADQDFGA